MSRDDPGCAGRRRAAAALWRAAEAEGSAEARADSSVKSLWTIRFGFKRKERAGRAWLESAKSGSMLLMLVKAEPPQKLTLLKETAVAAG